MQPWYPEKSLEIQARADYLFQAFDTVQSSHGDFSYRAQDSFLDLSLLGALEGWGAEVEVVISDTKQHSLYPDSFWLTGRYQIRNDTVGDPVSVIAGITAIVPTAAGLDDLSSFHHGHFEGEIHLAVGKETVCYDWWTSRYWAAGALGCALDEGSPWFRACFNYETNWDRTYFLHAFVKTLWGFGGNAIHRPHFDGYGSIAHQSVDLGARLSYLTESNLTISLGYAYRVYAYNFPEHANLVSFNLLSAF